MNTNEVINLVKYFNFCNGCTTASMRNMESCQVCDRFIAKQITMGALKDKAERENLEVLTLKRLEEMVHQPAYLVSSRFTGWILIKSIYNGKELNKYDGYYISFCKCSTINDIADLISINFKQGLFYRYPPKEDNKDGSTVQIL